MQIYFKGSADRYEGAIAIFLFEESIEHNLNFLSNGQKVFSF